MENWPNDLFKLIDDISVEVEHFFTDIDCVLETITEVMTEAFEEFSDRVVEDLQNLTYYLEDSAFIYFEEYYQDLFGELELDINIDNIQEQIRQDYNDDIFEINPKIDPHLVNQSTCVNCDHYHGRIYGGNLLVCGMHPYGWDGEECPDWENNISSINHI